MESSNNLDYDKNNLEYNKNNLEYDKNNLDYDKLSDDNINLNKDVWSIVDSFFKEHGLIDIQKTSFDQCIDQEIPQIIKDNNTIEMTYVDLKDEKKKYKIKIIINDNYKLVSPFTIDKNGIEHELLPSVARLRKFSYMSMIYVDIDIDIDIYEDDNFINKISKSFSKINIGKIPIMIKSKYCILTKKINYSSDELNECRYDTGGYFIINGNEKVLVSQERVADNNINCFKNSKDSKYIASVEIKSTNIERTEPPKLTSIKIVSKDDNNLNSIKVVFPYLKSEIPLFILFRALGIKSDLEIVKLIVYDINNPDSADLIELLNNSIDDSKEILDTHKAKLYLANYITNLPKDINNYKDKLVEYIDKLLITECIPHVGANLYKKAVFIGYMTRKLLLISLNRIEYDDRDSYINKRVERPGDLLANLFRLYYIKMLREAKNIITKEFNNGAWKATNNIANLFLDINIGKIFKQITIESGLKYALATGNFGMKNTFNKQGLSQLLSRLSFMSPESHKRRINTPIEKSGKLVDPRKLHGSQWGYICPVETPEGQSVGVVKNLALTCLVTGKSNPEPIKHYLRNKKGVIIIDNNNDNFKLEDLYYLTKLFINGDMFCGINNSEEVYAELKFMKRNGIINIYTSIVYDRLIDEMYIYTDAGRCVRPLFIVNDNKLNITTKIINLVKDGTYSWKHLITNAMDSNCKIENCIEFIDPLESYYSLIAINQQVLKKHTTKQYTHCEIHPSLILGLIASTIPFSDHNQSPRNTYQSAMCKQSMGLFATNFSKRLDTLSHVMYYAQKPIVNTYVTKHFNGLKMPHGINAIVAIATYTGYNQEDSVIMNQSAIERGLFHTAYYKTYRDEEKKQAFGDDEKFCKPNASNIIGMKVANYDKLNSNGFINQGEYVGYNDVIIGKCLRIRDGKYKDNSISLKNNEEGIATNIYVDKNADGYQFVNIEVRNERFPQIGDKFCVREDSYILTDTEWVKLKDININKHKVATLNDGVLEYVYPSNKYAFDCVEEELYHIESRDINITCTKNHKLYVKKNKSAEYEFIEAKDISGKVVRYKNNAINNFTDKEYIVFNNSRYLMNDWLKLLGIYITSGTKCTNYLKLCGLHHRSKKFIKSVCIKLDIEYIEKDVDIYIFTSNYNNIIQNLPDKNKESDLDKESDKGSDKDSYFPNYVWELSQNQCRILLASLIKAEDYFYIDDSLNNINYYETTNKILIHDIQRLILHCGWYGVISILDKYNVIKKNSDVNRKYKIYHIEIKTNQNNLWVNQKNKNFTTETYIKYTGKVGCIEVPNTHLFYYKENEFTPPVWTGNSSRHGQKGTVGMVYKQEDMPFSKDGIVPDIIMNPHAVPSRMTVAQLIELLLGKSCCELGYDGDGSIFTNWNPDDISNILQDLCGYEKHGNEILYNGHTGEQMKVSIFIGPTYYQRLKHMVIDKYHSRSTGPIVLMTRQPAEGRTREGGLRFGEMERDCMISHGAINFLKQRLLDNSDNYKVYICSKCHMIGNVNIAEKIYECKNCSNNNNFREVRIPYACKLLWQEIMAMGIMPTIHTNDKIKAITYK
tara:strand:+ start:4034 stop:8710 length:4677 start_codon:yes stop_codon:yes gene_type:complete